LELPRKRSGIGQIEITKKKLGIHNWTQKGEGIYIRTLCQKDGGPVEIKQRSIKMGGRITFWTLPPKRELFHLGLIDDPKVPTRRRISHTYPT
jgi:hypothetical protein